MLSKHDPMLFATLHNQCLHGFLRAVSAAAAAAQCGDDCSALLSTAQHCSAPDCGGDLPTNPCIS